MKHLATFVLSVLVAIAAVLGIQHAPQDGILGGGSIENLKVTFGNGFEVLAANGNTVVLSAGASGLNGRESIETATVDDTLLVAESMKTVYMGTAGVDITLPTAASAPGVTYRFVVSANFATTNMTVQGPASDATDDTIYGALEVAGAVVTCSARDTINFVNTAELPGDWITLRSDGTKWYLTGQGGTSGAITCTDVD